MDEKSFQRIGLQGGTRGGREGKEREHRQEEEKLSPRRRERGRSTENVPLAMLLLYLLPWVE